MIYKALRIIHKAWDRMLMYISRHSFRSIGKGCVFHPSNSDFTFNRMSLGDDVLIGDNARFWCTESAINIGDHVTFAPNASIIAGNHSFRKPGLWITKYKMSDKQPEDDLPVRIDNDVWVGTNVTILNGVHIGRGAIIAAGAVVTKDILPYNMGGVFPVNQLVTDLA